MRCLIYLCVRFNLYFKPQNDVKYLSDKNKIVSSFPEENLNIQHYFYSIYVE